MGNTDTCFSLFQALSVAIFKDTAQNVSDTDVTYKGSLGHHLTKKLSEGEVVKWMDT